MPPSLTEITAGFQEHAALRDLHPGVVLPSNPGASVLSAKQNGRAVIVKRWWGRPGAAESAAQGVQWVQQTLRKDPVHHVAALQAVVPNLNTIVLSHVPGAPLRDTLVSGSSKARRAATARCLDWLKAVGASTLTRDGFSAAYWCKVAKDLPEADLPDPERALIVRARDSLFRLAERTQGLQVSKSQGHSDFSVFNLHLTQTEVWAFDLHKMDPAPVVRMIAGFLSSPRLERYHTAARLTWGVDQAMWQAVAQSPVLMGAERSRALPVVIGVRLMQRLGRAGLTPHARDMRRTQLRNWIETADQAAIKA